MARLATLMIEKKEFFLPLAEHIMTDPKDSEKPGAFQQLFPHPLSRLLLVLMWRINREQDGDGVVLSNKWLKSFARLDTKSFNKYRDHLHDNHVICAKRLGSGREYLYRLTGRDRLPLASETDTNAVTRLKETGKNRRAIRKRLIRLFAKKVNKKATASDDLWPATLDDDTPM
jgi:hypothetical protein